MKKWIISLIVLIIAGGASYWFFFNSKPKQAFAQARTVTVQKGKLDVTVSGSGNVQAVSSQDVQATAAKQIDTVSVTQGQEVTAGQTIATFTDGTLITAPIDGTVTSVSIASGDHVSVGKAIAHITNYKDLQTTASIDELDIPQVQVGQTVTLKASAFPDETLTGKVTAIANEGTVSNGVSTFNVTVHIDDPKSLKVGMSIDANILTNSKDNVVYVPVEAVHTKGNQKFVLIRMTDDQGKATVQQKVVKTGIHNADSVEITEGLSQGEIVQLPTLAVSQTNGQGGQGGRNGSGGFGMYGGSGFGGGMKMGGGSGSGRGGN